MSENNERKLNNFQINNDEEELIVEEKGLLKVFLEGEKGEVSQEEEIEQFKLKKEEEKSNEILSEEKLINKRKKYEEEEEELKQIKHELVASLERVKEITKRIYGGINLKDRADFRENEKIIQKGKRKVGSGKSIKIEKIEEQDKGFGRD